MILASGSPRRRELLEELGIRPDIRPSSIDETPLPDETPPELVKRLSLEKAMVCLKSLGEDERDTILAADTIVWGEDGLPLGKPASEEDARTMLRRLSGRTHHVSTGVCLIFADDPSEPTSFVETTDVEFFDLTEAMVESYVSSGEPRDKAGSYGIQGLGRLLVKAIRGDYYNVVGLPVARVIREVQHHGNGNEKIMASILEGTRE